MPHHASASLIFLQDGKREVSQEAGSETLHCGVIDHVIPNQMCTQPWHNMGSHRAGAVCTLTLLVSLAKVPVTCF